MPTSTSSATWEGGLRGGRGDDDRLKGNADDDKVRGGQGNDEVGGNDGHDRVQAHLLLGLANGSGDQIDVDLDIEQGTRGYAGATGVCEFGGSVSYGDPDPPPPASLPSHVEPWAPAGAGPWTAGHLRLTGPA